MRSTSEKPSPALGLPRQYRIKHFTKIHLASKRATGVIRGAGTQRRFSLIGLTFPRTIVRHFSSTQNFCFFIFWMSRFFHLPSCFLSGSALEGFRNYSTWVACMDVGALPSQISLFVAPSMHCSFHCSPCLYSKGISASAIPYKRTPPSWLKVTPEQVNEHVAKLAKKGLTPSQIGVILRDSHGIGQVRNVTGSKILRILKANGSLSSISY